MRAVLSGTDFQLAPFHPMRKYDTENVRVRLAGSKTFLLTMHARIDALGQEHV
jgi:hypothetical protein